MPIDQDERDEILRQMQATKQYLIELMRHPDCMDPEHPGCGCCEGEDDEGEHDGMATD